VLPLQTSSTLADCGPEEWSPGLGWIVCCVAGAVQPTMARMKAAPGKNECRMANPPSEIATNDQSKNNIASLDGAQTGLFDTGPVAG
jgi:hypothetical protein